MSRKETTNEFKEKLVLIEKKQEKEIKLLKDQIKEKIDY